MRSNQLRDDVILLRKTTLEPKAGEYQYKLLNRGVCTNKIPHRMGERTTPLCSFCGRSNECFSRAFIHLLWVCLWFLALSDKLVRKIRYECKCLERCKHNFWNREKRYSIQWSITLFSLVKNLSIGVALTLLIKKVKYTYKAITLSIFTKINDSLCCHCFKYTFCCCCCCVRWLHRVYCSLFCIVLI